MYVLFRDNNICSVYSYNVGIFKTNIERIMSMQGEVLIRLTQLELEKLIEVLERNRHDEPNENNLRKDLKDIRAKIEIERNKVVEGNAKKPDEKLRLIPNPTSAEHVK